MPHNNRLPASIIVVLTLALFMALSLTVAAADPEMAFASEVTYSGNSSAWNLEFGDLDNDGVLDMVVADTGGDRLQVRMGAGDGTFGLSSYHTTHAAGRPTGIILADLNGDGDLDAAAANRDTWDVSVLVGNGAGSFGAPTQYGLSYEGYDLAAGDMDNDGDIDLVAYAYVNDSLGILMNDGSGTFAAPVYYELSVDGYRICVADLNNDGWLDVAAAVIDAGVAEVLLNNGDGTLATYVSYPITGYTGDPADIIAADLDQDGWLDLVTANRNTDNVSVFLNDGDGTFGASVEYPAGDQGEAVLAADLNGDGILDLVVSDTANNRIGVLAGVGDGTFEAMTTFAATQWPVGLACADLDRDGRPDLAHTNRVTTGSAGVLMNTSDWVGVSHGAVVGTAPMPGGVKDVALGDLNHDGLMDVVALVDQSNMFDDVLAVSLRQPDGSYSVPITDTAGRQVNQVALGDLDHDGDLDVVVTCDQSAYFGVWLNDGSGAMGTRTDVPTWQYNYGLALVDWDRDGHLDIVMTNRAMDLAAVYAGNGMGGFGGANPASTGINSAPYALAVGDLNHDGLPDAALTMHDSGMAATMLNSGAGNFMAPNPYPAGIAPYDCDLADLNGDGNLDALAVSSVADTLYTYAGVGDGTLSPPSSYGTGGFVASVRAGDVDRDGDQDVIAPQGGTAYRYTNDGAGVLGAAEAVGSLSNIKAILDVDDNGMPDLVGSAGSDVVILYGTEDKVELSIAKSVEPAAPFWGDAITYTIAISNTGNLTGTGVLVTDTFPSGYVADVVSATSGLAMSNFSYGAEWAWTVEDIAPGASGTITLTGVLTDYVTVGDPFDNVAEIDCNETDVVSDTASATVGSGCVPTFTVISDADDGPGTLRQGMAYVCDGGVIDFDLTYPATITLTSGRLDRSGELTVNGPGASSLAVSGNNASRIILASHGITLTQLTLRDGSSPDGGGAVDGLLSVALSGTQVLDCTSVNNGGAVRAMNAITVEDSLVRGNYAAAHHGAFSAGGNLIIANSQVLSNRAEGWEGAFSGHDVTISDSLFQENAAVTGSDGVGRCHGALAISNTDFVSNTASGDWGVMRAENDVHISGSRFQGNKALGGEAGAFLAVGHVMVTNTQFISNTASEYRGAFRAQGDLVIRDSLLQGNVAESQDCGGLWCEGEAVVINTDLIDNRASGYYGAMCSLGDTHISDSLFQGNKAQSGSDGAFYSGASATVTNTEFISNTAGAYNGGFYAEGDVTVTNSLFQGNEAQTENNGAFWCESGNVAVVDSLFVGNRAGTWSGGFGTWGDALVLNSDFIDNYAVAGTGAFYADGTLDMSDSLVQECGGAESGGVWVEGVVTITNTQFISNTASLYAGALYGAAAIEIADSTLSGNTAGSEGGAVYGVAGVAITGGRFERNQATTAGGAVWADTVAISGTQFISNTQTSTAAPTHCGGAVYYDTLATVENALFERNASGMYGGGLGTNYSGAALATITNTTFLSNTARAGGGVHAVDAVLVGCTATGNQAAYNGGALVAEDGASVVGGTFVANTAANGGGAAAAKIIHAQDATFTRNTASSAGALAGDTTASATNCTFTENEATGLGAGMQYGAGAVGGLAGLTLDSCEFYSNTTGLDGGAAGTAGLAYITGSTFEGNSADQTGGAVCISMTGQLMLTDSTFEDNVAGADGGAVLAQKDAIVVGCEFIGNTMTGTRNYGGALRMTGGGENGVINSTFRANHSNGMGGAIGIDWSTLGSLGDDLKTGAPAPVVISNTSVLSNTANVGGGGIVVDSGHVAMYDSTVAYNVADDGDGWGTGGGIQFMDIETSSLTNCTIANNTAAGADDDGGGGIMVYHMLPATKNLELSHVSIVGNVSAAGAGGVAVMAPEHPMAVAMTATLIAGNTTSGGSPADILANIVSHQGNLIGVVYDSTGLDPLADQYGSALSPLDALTGPLGNYGGDTLTVPLLPGSPAINTGGPSLIAFDQRGVTRDLGPDVGAFESRGFGLAYVSGDNQQTPAGSPFPQPLVAGVSSSYGEPVDGGVVAYSAPMSGASATFTPADPAKISGGQVSVTATANDVVGGPYLAQARIPSSSVMVTGLEKPTGVYYALTNTVPLTAESSYAAGPDPVCPGHNIYHTLIVTNTSAALGMAGLEAVGAVPDGTEFYGDMSPEGVYNEAIGEIAWNLPEVPAGEAAVIEWTTHVLNGTASDTELFGAATWTCDLLPGETHTATVTVDDEGCAPPPPEPLTIHGVVYVHDLVAPARSGSLKGDVPIEGATVTATTCVAGAWVDVTNADGEYVITIPGQVAEGCDEITLEVYAEGYGEDSGTWSVAELRADGVRDWAFEPPEEHWLYLPLLLN